MSVINFVCSDAQKETVKTEAWNIIREHYLSTVFPNTNVEFEYKGEDVYRPLMEELMKFELCSIEETDNGVAVTFDSTEDAGFSIAASVYETGMGYSDQGLTFLPPVFKKIVETLPEISFDADTECVDEWVSQEYHYSYDGEKLTIEGVDFDTYELVMKNMNPFVEPEDLAEQLGLDADTVIDIIETFCE